MRTSIIMTLITTGLGLVGHSASASSPAGVWSIPQLVQVLEEASDRPLVVLEGLFARYTGDGEAPIGLSGYAEAEWGVMYYRCLAGEKELCLMQWDELKTAAASSDACRGWGNQEEAPGTIRAYGTPSDPDDFRISGGVVTGFTPCEYLRAIPAPEPVAYGTAEPVADETAEPVAEAAVEEIVEPVVEAPVATEEAPVESGGDTRPEPAPNVEDEGGGCAAGGADAALLGLIALGLVLRRRRC